MRKSPSQRRLWKGDEGEVASGGDLAELFRFGAGGGEGLVDDDVFAGEEGLFGEVEVGFVGGADDYELDGWVGEGLVGGAKDAGGRVGFGRLVAAALDDCLEFEAGDCADEGGVKDASC